MQPVPGAIATGVVVGMVFAHETMALKYDPEQLITRVIARWRVRHPILIDAVICYFALHLMNRVPYDPLQIRIKIIVPS